MYALVSDIPLQSKLDKLYFAVETYLEKEDMSSLTKMADIAIKLDMDVELRVSVLRALSRAKQSIPSYKTLLDKAISEAPEGNSRMFRGLIDKEV